MALQKQPIDFPFSGGLNEKIAEKILPAGQFSELENVELDTVGALRKRGGHTALASSIIGGGTVESARRLASYRNELLIADGTNLYGKIGDASSGAWSNRGSLVCSRVTVDPVISEISDGILGLTTGYANGYYVLAYRLAAGYGPASDWYFSVVEGATGAVVQKNVLLDSGGVGSDVHMGVRVVSLPGASTVVVVYADATGNTNIKAKIFDLTDPSTDPSPVNLVTDAESSTANKNFDAVADVVTTGNYWYLLYWANTGTTDVVLAAFNASGSLQDSLTLDSGTYTPGGRLHIGFDSQRLYCFVHETTNLRVAGASVSRFPLLSLSSLFGFAWVHSGLFAHSFLKAVTAAATSSTSVRVFFEIYSGYVSLPNNTIIQKAEVTSAGAISGNSVFMRSVGIASRAWTRDYVPYLAVIHESASGATPTSVGARQNTGFVVDGTGNIIARFLTARAGHVNDGRPMWSDLAFPSTNVVTFAHFRLGQNMIASVDDGAATLVEIDFGKSGNFVEYGNNLFSPQGHLYSYDGKTVAEHGFHLYPHGSTTNSTPVTGGHLVDGAYQLCFVYEWTDDRGQRHTSAPSAVHQVTLSGGGSGQRILVDVPTLRLTGKTSVLIAVFRTKVDSSGPFYLENIAANDPSVDVVTIQAGRTDADIGNERKLYTTGNVLDHIAPSPASFAVDHDSRLFLLGTDGRIYFSKQRIADEGIGFNDGLYLVPDAADGKPTGLASQDGQLIIGTAVRLLRVIGSGPNDLGQGGYQEPIKLASDVSVQNGSAMLTFSAGTLVPSAKGLWLLNRGLSLEYIGGMIKDSIAGELVGAALHPTRNELVLAYSQADSLLVFDLDRKLWKHQTAPDGFVDVVADASNMFVGFSDGTVWQYDPAEYQDDGTDYSMRLKTGELRFAGLNGYQRLWEIRVLGKFLSAHTLNVRLHHAKGITETFTKAVAAADEPYQFSINPRFQKVPAIAIEIWDSSPGGSRESVELYGLSFDVGIKPKRPFKASKSL